MMIFVLAFFTFECHPLGVLLRYPHDYSSENISLELLPPLGRKQSYLRSLWASMKLQNPNWIKQACRCLNSTTKRIRNTFTDEHG